MNVRISNALVIAKQNTDGAHHKDWVIDQMVRALFGCPFEGDPHTGGYGTNQEYLDWVERFEDGEDGPKTYIWETGDSDDEEPAGEEQPPCHLEPSECWKCVRGCEERGQYFQIGGEAA